MKTYKDFILENSKLIQDLSDLHKHITTTEPTGSNITKLHDIVHSISQAYEIPHDELYKSVINNTDAHSKYKEASAD